MDFWNLDEILNILNKRMTLIEFIFSKLRTPKTKSGKCLKSPVSEDASRSHMVNVPKHCWNVHHIPFITFIRQWQRNCFRKSFSYWHVKFWEDIVNTLSNDEKYLLHYRDNLTLPLQMQFLKNKKHFLSFWLHFWNLD